MFLKSGKKHRSLGNFAASVTRRQSNFINHDPTNYEYHKTGLIHERFKILILYGVSTGTDFEHRGDTEILKKTRKRQENFGHRLIRVRTLTVTGSLMTGAR